MRWCLVSPELISTSRWTRILVDEKDLTTNEVKDFRRTGPSPCDESEVGNTAEGREREGNTLSGIPVLGRRIRQFTQACLET